MHLIHCVSDFQPVLIDATCNFLLSGSFFSLSSVLLYRVVALVSTVLIMIKCTLVFYARLDSNDDELSAESIRVGVTSIARCMDYNETKTKTLSITCRG